MCWKLKSRSFEAADALASVYLTVERILHTDIKDIKDGDGGLGVDPTTRTLKMLCPLYSIGPLYRCDEAAVNIVVIFVFRGR